MALSWLRWIVAAGLSLWMSGFNPRLVYVGFVLGKVALGQIFLEVL